MPAECIECPACAANAPTAGIESGQFGVGDCRCRTCCCGVPKISNKCYKQPRIPESYAPRRAYCRPSAPLEACTTYGLSYLPAAGCTGLRAEVQRPPPNLVPSCMPMEGDTIQKTSGIGASGEIPLHSTSFSGATGAAGASSSAGRAGSASLGSLSYQPNPICVRSAVRPCHHAMGGSGPLQSVTTQRHDYVPKPCAVRRSMKPPPKFHCMDVPFEDKTVNRLSYLAPDQCGRPPSFAPQRLYEKPAAAMDGTTVQKMSYRPNAVCPKDPTPWAKQLPYVRPCQPLEDCTTYKLSYLDSPGDCRRMPILPNRCMNPVTPSKRFECGTVYRNSYLPAQSPIPLPVRPLPNLTLSEQPMEGETVQKLSYLPNPICVRSAVRPCHHALGGTGPMQSVTTQRHDYVAKPCSQRIPFKAPAHIRPCDVSMENKTINKLSYLDPGRCGRPVSFKPIICYEKPCAKMDGETIQKMSYRNVCTRPREIPPWADRGSYIRPCGPLEGTTIYKASFMPPGEDCTEITDPCSYGDCKDCKCDYPSQCIPNNACACDFPKAAVNCS